MKLPEQSPPAPPTNTWLQRLVQRLKEPSGWVPRYKHDEFPTGIDVGIQRRRDLRSVLADASLAEIEQAIADQRKYKNDLYYAHEEAVELLNDIISIKNGTAGI